MKKFLVTLCSIFIICATFLTGCNLTSRNNAKYYNQIVASAGDVNVTMQELIYAVNLQTQNSGARITKEAVTETLNNLLNEKLFLNYFTKDNKVVVSEEEKNYCLNQAHLAVNSAIESFEKTVMLELGFLQAATKEEEDSSETTYEEYVEAISFVDGQFVFNAENQTVEKLNSAPVFAFTSSNSLEVQSRARELYFNSLRENAKALGKKDLSNEALLKEEINRLYQAYVQSALATKINENYLEINNNAMNAINDEISSYLEYAVRAEKNYLLRKGANLTVSDVEALNYYCPTSVSENFFEVVHVLIGFGENYDSELKALEDKVAQGEIDESAIANFKEQASNQAEQEATELKAELEANFIGKSQQEKENLFREYMFEHTGDKATLTSSANYVIPVDAALDTMVKEFANTSRSLYNAGSGEACSLGLASTEYGCHIIMYLGEYSKIADENTVFNETSKTQLLEKLYNHKLKSGFNKSAYHAIYERIIGNVNTFDTYFNERIAFEKDELKNNNKKIVIYNKRIKFLWE